MKNISNEVMEIIIAIQHYIDKNGNTELVDKSYQSHDTYSGIVEYLNGIANQKHEVTWNKMNLII